MRQRISDKNIFPVFSLENEYKKLHDLFFDRSEFGLLVGPLKNSKARPSLSYNDCLQSMFLDWELRGSFTSLEEMLLGLQISEDDFDKECTEERLLVASGRYAEQTTTWMLYADGRTTKEAYLRKKEAVCRRIDEVEKTVKSHEAVLSEQKDLLESVSEVTMLTQQHLDDDKISFDAVDDFIEAVYVYGPEKVEIVFRFEDQLQILKDKETVCQKAV